MYLEKLGFKTTPWGVPGANVFRVISKDEKRCIVENTMPEDVNYGQDKIGWDPKDSGEAYKHSLLIAAAPEMLEALIESVVNYDFCNDGNFHDPDIEDQRKIIQKATGKTWEEIKEIIK